MANQDFENTLTTLLTQAAEQVSPQRDIVSFVQQTGASPANDLLSIHQIDDTLSGVTASTKTPIARYTSRFIAFLSAATLVALVIGLFIWIHPHAQQKPSVSPIATIKTSPHCPSLPTTLNNSATLYGITVQVSQLYADMSRTSLEFKIVDTTGKQTYFDAIDQLEDGCGHQYQSTQVSSRSISIGNTVTQQQFAPLPETEAGANETMTLVVNTISFGQGAGNPRGNLIPGPWKIVIKVHVGQTQTVPINTASQTHDGLTIRPVTAEWIQTAPQFDGLTGGIRLRLHLSGLPLPADFETLHFLDSNSSGGSSLGEFVQFTLPDGQRLTPTFVSPIVTSNALAFNPTQFITSTGEADIDFIYLSALPPQSSVSALTLGIVKASYSVAGRVQGDISPHNSEYTFTGPWNFQIPHQ